MQTLKDSYLALRNTVGVYDRGHCVVRLTGEDRLAVAQRLLAKSIHFTPVHSSLESLLLDTDGAVAGIALALLHEDSIDLVVDGDPEWVQHATSIAVNSRTELMVTSSRALAIEGPKSWHLIESLLPHHDVADLLLQECAPVPEHPECWVTRTGTTAEFGYVVVGASEELRRKLVEAAKTLEGGEIDPGALERVRIETNYPVLPQQSRDVTLLEAGIGWLATMGRADDCVGAHALIVPAPTRRVVAARMRGAHPAVGTAVRDGERLIGRVHVTADRCGNDESVVLLLLDDPYGVPGLSVTVDGRVAHTVARPVITPVSWDSQIGVH